MLILTALFLTVLFVFPVQAQIFEDCEGPGWSYPWDDIVATPGNGWNPDFPTSNLPVSGWGDETCGFGINTVGGSLVRESLDSPDLLPTRFELLVAYSLMAEEEQVTVAAAKQTHNCENERLAWVTHIWQVAQGLELRFSFGMHTSTPVVLSVPISEFTQVSVEIVYDGSDYSVTVDGVEIGSGQIQEEWADAIYLRVIGASGSGTGQGIVFFVDNYEAGH